MTNKSVKTWRVFLFGLGCILAGIYLRRALTYFRVIRGNLLSNSIVLVAVIWFVAGIVRLYRLHRLYPETKTAVYKDKWCIIEAVIIFILVAGLTLTGCGARNVQEPSETLQSGEDENITESIENTEYDSIVGFFANNSTPVFVLDPNKESNSGNESFSALDKKASVAKSYLAVTYECEINSNKLQVKLATCNSDNGKNS